LNNVADDDDDTIAIIFSGHGQQYSGSSGGFVTYTGSYLWDDELASYLDDNDASHIFCFFMCCHSGCFLDDLENMPNSEAVFATSACDCSGLAPAPDDLENGAWSYFYLDVYSNHPSWYHENIYSEAKDDWEIYWDEHQVEPLEDEYPQMYDGKYGTNFYMNPY
jgi:hypothetical protein